MVCENMNMKHGAALVRVRGRGQGSSVFGADFATGENSKTSVHCYRL